MPIRTGSVLDQLCNDVDKHRNRVIRAQARVDSLRDLYRTAHHTKRREIAGKGFKAREALAKAESDLQAAELALRAEETRLQQSGSFLRFA